MKHEFGIRAFIKLIVISLLNNPINLFRRKYVRILLRAIVGDYHIDRTKYLMSKMLPFFKNYTKADTCS